MKPRVELFATFDAWFVIKDIATHSLKEHHRYVNVTPPLAWVVVDGFQLPPSECACGVKGSMKEVDDHMVDLVTTAALLEFGYEDTPAEHAVFRSLTNRLASDNGIDTVPENYITMTIGELFGTLDAILGGS